MTKKKSSRPLKITLRKPIGIKTTPRDRTLQFPSEVGKLKTNIENVLRNSNCTPFRTKTIFGIDCAYCKQTLKTIQDLRTHVNEAHKNATLYKKKVEQNNLLYKVDITDLKCTICNKNIELIANLKDHLTKEHNIEFYSDVKDYILEFKLTTDELLSCAVCNSTYETFKMLLQHMNGHYRNYICDVCDMGFVNKYKMQKHRRTHDVGSFKCSFCEKIFTTKVRKVCHEKYTHATKARYKTKCPHCDKTFTNYHQRNTHMRSEHDTAAANYKCNICDITFTMKSELTSHTRELHLMEKHHVCSVCNEGFSSKRRLQEHSVKHAGRIYKCAVCLKGYARKKTLEDHMWIHNNDKRFKCSICGSAFVYKCGLKSHLRSNHGFSMEEYEASRMELEKEAKN